MKTIIFLAFWLLVFTLVRLLWRFATRPRPTKGKPASANVRVADAFTRATAKAVAGALSALMAAVMILAIIALLIASAD